MFIKAKKKNVHANCLILIKPMYTDDLFSITRDPWIKSFTQEQKFLCHFISKCCIVKIYYIPRLNLTLNNT